MDPLPTPDQLRLPPGSIPKAKRTRSRLPRHRSGQRFLRGPVPISWIVRAAREGGKGLHVGIALWFYAGLKRNRTVALNLSQCGEFGFDRFSGARGLVALERAGLVRVERHAGRKPVVTILDVLSAHVEAPGESTDEP